LPLLASLEKKSTYGVLGCFLGVENGDDFEEGVLVDEATGNRFVLFWKAMIRLEVEALFCF